MWPFTAINRKAAKIVAKIDQKIEEEIRLDKVANNKIEADYRRSAFEAWQKLPSMEDHLLEGDNASRCFACGNYWRTMKPTLHSLNKFMPQYLEWNCPCGCIKQTKTFDGSPGELFKEMLERFSDFRPLPVSTEKGE